MHVLVWVWVAMSVTRHSLSLCVCGEEEQTEGLSGWQRAQRGD